ncbi:unnamed protein product [Boreogadus saida]
MMWTSDYPSQTIAPKHVPPMFPGSQKGCRVPFPFGEPGFAEVIKMCFSMLMETPFGAINHYKGSLVCWEEENASAEMVPLEGVKATCFFKRGGGVMGDGGSTMDSSSLHGLLAPGPTLP